MERKYIVSRDQRSGLWYAHMKGFAYVPVAGSISKHKADAMEYAKMYNLLPNKVEQIEKRRKHEFEKSLGEI